MFLKTPKSSTDQRLRSLLQKAARRGYSKIVDTVAQRLDRSGDKAWLKSRSVVITFEECWPLAECLKIGPDFSSKRFALLDATRSAKQKDAASLGALAYAYHDGDQSMLDCIPSDYSLRIISTALDRPPAFFEWVLSQAKTSKARGAAEVAQKYLSVATWQWDKACILAGALLATQDDLTLGLAPTPQEDFPYWAALDKHTPQGKEALSRVAKELGVHYRQLIWASFYLESAKVNELIPSPWWRSEMTWRFRKAHLSLHEADELWSRARPLMQKTLQEDADALKELVELSNEQSLFPSASPEH